MMSYRDRRYPHVPDVPITRQGDELKMQQGSSEIVISREMVSQFFDCLLGAAGETDEERDWLRAGAASCDRKSW